jgi:hypothetical protein
VQFDGLRVSLTSRKEKKIEGGINATAARLSFSQSGNTNEREIEMNGGYKAVEVSTPDELRVVERPISKPAAGQVRLRVEACGVCHSDLATVQRRLSRIEIATSA